MKIFKLLSLCLIAALFLFACGASVENNPESVAKAFINYLNDFNFSEAKKLCTEEGADTIKTLEMFITDDMKSEAKEAAGDQTVEVTNVDESGDSATVEYTVGGVSQMPLSLVKVDGNWKVDFKKEM